MENMKWFQRLSGGIVTDLGVEITKLGCAVCNISKKLFTAHFVKHETTK